MKVTLTICIFLITCLISNAQKALSDPWVTNGSVNSISPGDGKIFLGGSFDWAGPAYGSGAAVFDATLTYDGSYPLVGNNLRTAIQDDAGGWYIAGDRKIFHLKADKTVVELPVDVDGFLSALAKIGNILYISGSFTSVNSTARTALASIDLTTNTLTNWNPNPNGSVEALIGSGTILYAGGRFTTIGGQTRSRIAALDASTGLATAWNANVALGSGFVQAIIVDSNAIYFGGGFSNVGGGVPARTNFAAVNTTTGALLSFNPRPNSLVYDLLLDGTTLFMAGNFTQIVGVAKDRFAVVDVGTGTFSAFDVTFNDNAEVTAFAIDGQKLFISGTFTTVNGEDQPRLAALNKTTGASEPMDVGKISGVPNVLVISGGQLLTVSEDYFQGVTGVAFNRGALALDENTGQPTGWTPELPLLAADEYLADVSVHYHNNRVYYLQKIYYSIDGYYESVLGAVNPTDGAAINGWSVTVDNEIDAWTFSDDALYLAGQFTDVNGVARAGFAAVDLETGDVLPWTINYVPDAHEVSSMAVHNNVIYVGGEFFFDDNGEERNHVAAWDATTGVLSDWKPMDFTDRVRIGAVDDAHVYILGKGVAVRVDPNTGETDATWEPVFDEEDFITSMALYDTYVYLGVSMAPDGLAHLVSVDRSTGEIAGTQPDLDDNYASEGSEVNTIVVSGTKLLVGGDFHYEIDGILRSNYAEYVLPDPTNPPTNEPPQILATTAAVLVEGSITIDLEPLITDPDDNLDASTLQLIDPSSEHGASAILDGFALTLNYGGVPFNGTDRITIGICDLLGECVEQQLTIEVTGDIIVYNAVSPNGDSKNEVLMLQYIESFGKNKVAIFNRWGDLVFEVSDYNNTDRVFKGLNENGNELPSGTYFYKVEFSGSKKAKSGYLSLKR